MVVKNYILCIVLIVFGFVIYSNTYTVPYYSDDIPNILHNEAIRIDSLSDLTLDNLTQSGPNRYRIIANMSFAFNYLLSKYDVFSYHLVNNIIHILNGILLFFLINYTVNLSNYPVSRKQIPIIAFFSALLWLVHPVQTQAVTYIVQRMTSLATMLYLLALLCYVQGRITTAGRLPVLWFVFSALFSLLAFITKEISFTLPGVIFLYEWYFFQNGSLEWVKRNRVNFMILFVLLAMVFFVLELKALSTIMAVYESKEFNLIERLLTESRVLMFYLGLIVFPLPTRLSLVHDFEISTSLLSPITTLVSVLSLSAVTVTAIFLFKKNKLLSFSIFWIVVNLLIESTVIPLEIIFEHRMYLPSMFLFLIIILLLHDLFKNKYIVYSSVVIVVFVLSIATYARNDAWASPDKFYTNMINTASNNHIVYYEYGVYLKERGEYEKSALYLEKTLKVKPGDTLAHYELGTVCLYLNNFNMALDHYKEVLKRMPGFPQIYFNIGFAYRKLNDYVEAEKYFSEVIMLDPEDLDAHSELAQMFMEQKKFKKAMYHYDKILDIAEEDIFSVQLNLGTCFAYLGNFEKALEHFSLALEMDPTHTMLIRNIELAREKIKTRTH